MISNSESSVSRTNPQQAPASQNLPPSLPELVQSHEQQTQTWFELSRLHREREQTIDKTSCLATACCFPLLCGAQLLSKASCGCFPLILGCCIDLTSSCCCMKEPLNICCGETALQTAERVNRAFMVMSAIDCEIEEECVGSFAAEDQRDLTFYALCSMHCLYKRLCDDPLYPRGNWPFLTGPERQTIEDIKPNLGLLEIDQVFDELGRIPQLCMAVAERIPSERVRGRVLSRIEEFSNARAPRVLQNDALLSHDDNYDQVNEPLLESN